MRFVLYVSAGNSARESLHVAFGVTSKVAGGVGGAGARPASSRQGSTAGASSVGAYHATGGEVGGGSAGARAFVIGTHARRNSAADLLTISGGQTRPLSVGVPTHGDA